MIFKLKFIPSELKIDKELVGRIFYKNKKSIDKIKSVILSKDDFNNLTKLCEFPQNFEWSLLYRGTRDGMNSESFHDKCDNHSNTITVIKSSNGNIFGAYSACMWDSTNNWRHDPNAFIFSLKNSRNQVFKCPIPKYSIGSFSFYGPLFGNKTIRIFEYKIASTYSIFPDPLNPVPSINQGEHLLSGSKDFKLEEIEIFEIIS